MSFLLDIFFPKRCVVCQRSGTVLCDDCFEILKETEQKCPMCCQRSFGGKTHARCKKSWGVDGLISLWSYRQKEVQKIIKAVKYKFSQEVVGVIFTKNNISKIKADLIIPIPLFINRKRWRGFNQAELIAEHLGKKWEIEVVNALVRKKQTKPLAELKAGLDRKREIKNAFTLDSSFKHKILNKSVLLVDDVFTSGATMKEAAKVLRRAMVKEVWGVTIAN